MKQLEVSEGKLHESISKPRGGKDDRVDSFMMSLYPWVLEEDGEEGFELITPDEDDKVEAPYGRVDTFAKELGLYDPTSEKEKELKEEFKEEYEAWYG